MNPLSGPTTTQDVQLMDDRQLENRLREFTVNFLREYVVRRIPAKLQSVFSPEDIMQEIWSAVFRSYETKFTPNRPDAFERWVVTIAKATLAKTLRDANTVKRGRRHVVIRQNQDVQSSLLDLFGLVAPSQPTPSGEVAVKEAIEAVRLALDQLPENRRKAIWLYHIEGKKREEIAAEMGKSLDTVKTWLKAGRKQLRELLGPASKFFSDAVCLDGAASQNGNGQLKAFSESQCPKPSLASEEKLRE